MTANPPHGLTSRLDRASRLSRQTRRGVVLATLLALPASFVWSTFWLGTSAPSYLWGPVTFALIGVTVVGAFLLYGYVGRRAAFPNTDLDERQQQLRDRAWILSYQVLSTVIIAGVSAAAIKAFVLAQPITLDVGLVNQLILMVAVLLPILPSAALAWIEPDPIEEA